MCSLTLRFQDQLSIKAFPWKHVTVLISIYILHKIHSFDPVLHILSFDGI